MEKVSRDTKTVDVEMRAPKDIVKAKRGNPKLASSLNQLLGAYHQGGMIEAQAFAKAHTMVVVEDRVQVTIVSTAEDIGKVRSAMEAVGGEYQLHHKNLLQALVPISQLEALAQSSQVLMVREPRRAIMQQ